MPIEVKCPRCSTLLKVPDRKAGRRGRCPICGGPVKIPLVVIAPMPFAAPQKPARSRLIWVIPAGIVLLIGIWVIVALSGHGKSGATEESSGPALTPEQMSRRDAQLLEISKLEDMVRIFRELRVKEKHLRARDVLMKISSYEPVTDFEYALRGQVLEEQEKAAKSAGDAGGENEAWNLNTPLAPSEKAELGRLSDDLQTESADLARELSSIGIFLAPVKDPLGRALLDGAEVSEKLVARRERIVKDAGTAAP
jgi:hypothetical protein